MSKFTENFKKFHKAYIVTFFISFFIGVGIFCIYFFLNGYYILSALNGVSISAFSLLGIAGLMWVQYEGMFDIFAYGFKQMFTSFFSKTANKYNDMHSYKQSKIEKRERSPHLHFSMIFAAFIFVIAIAVLEIIYHTVPFVA